MNESHVELQQEAMTWIQTIQSCFYDRLAEKHIAVWGMTSLNSQLDEVGCLIIDWLVEQGAFVVIHEANVLDELKARVGTRDVVYADTQWDAVRHANALIVVGFQPHYCLIDAGRLSWLMKQRTLFDLYATVDRDSLQYSDFVHFSVSEGNLSTGPRIQETSRHARPVFLRDWTPVNFSPRRNARLSPQN